MGENKKLYTHEPDGTISTWYLCAWYGQRFSVSPKKNAKLRDHKRFYHMNEIGDRIFTTRKEAEAAEPVWYRFHTQEGEAEP